MFWETSFLVISGFLICAFMGVRLRTGKGVGIGVGAGQWGWAGGGGGLAGGRGVGRVRVRCGSGVGRVLVRYMLSSFFCENSRLPPDNTRPVWLIVFVFWGGGRPGISGNKAG